MCVYFPELKKEKKKKLTSKLSLLSEEPVPQLGFSNVDSAFVELKVFGLMLMIPNAPWVPLLVQ